MPAFLSRGTLDPTASLAAPALHAPEHGVSELLVHGDRSRVGGAHEEVNKVALVAAGRGGGQGGERGRATSK